MKDAGKCIVCRCQVWIPDALYEAATASNRVSFYCSYGHGMSFAQGETDLEKARRERDRLAQRIAEKDDEITYQRTQREAAERRLSAAKGQVTKIKNRVGHGVCPCCTRSFGNLQRHMQSQHPDYSHTSETVQ